MLEEIVRHSDDANCQGRRLIVVLEPHPAGGDICMQSAQRTATASGRSILSSV